MTDDPGLEIERVQTGVRIEKRILKVLKAFAEYHDMTLGDVLEGIVLHAFDQPSAERNQVHGPTETFEWTARPLRG